MVLHFTGLWPAKELRYNKNSAITKILKSYVMFALKRSNYCSQFIQFTFAKYGKYFLAVS